MTPSQVTFEIRGTLLPGEVFAICGSCDALGNWNPQNAVALINENETGDSVLWKAVIALNRGVSVKYRYFRGCFLEPKTIGGPCQVIVHKWETHLQPRSITPLESEIIIDDGQFGIHNGVETLDSGWLTCQTEIRLRLHFSEKPPVSISKKKFKKSRFRVKLTLEGLEEDEDDDDDKVSPTVLHKMSNSLEISLISDNEFKCRHSQPECGYGLQPDRWTEYSIQTMEPDNLELIFDFFEEDLSEHVVQGDVLPGHVGTACLLSSTIAESGRSAGILTLPIMSRNSRKTIGKVRVDFIIIKPLPGYSCSMQSSFSKYWKPRIPLDVGHRGAGCGRHPRGRVVPAPRRRWAPGRAAGAARPGGRPGGRRGGGWMRVGPDHPAGEPPRHVQVRPRSAVLNMLRRLDRIRFRGHKREDLLDLAESPNASDTECGDEIPLKTPRPSPRDSEELRDPAGPGTLIMAAGVQDFNRTEFDRLNEIKGHLEIALLEKHFLQEELRKLREETNSEMLRQELDRERQRRIELEQKMQEVLKARSEEQPAQPQQPPKGQSQASNGTGTERRSQGLASRVQKWFYERFGEYIEDFRFQPEENTVETEEPLSARRLTENMRRLKRGAKPVTNFVKNLSALSDWYSIYTSAIAFTVYMNAVWHGWAIPMFLFLAILRLSLNYLIARGWRIQWSIVPEVSEAVEPAKEDLTVSEKFQLVLDVAQKAQNLFGKMADILEKIKNLFMWVQPETTQKLYVALWAAFLASCFFPYRLVGLAVGLYAGIKFFLIDFIFKRCPRLRAKYDTPYIIWRSLPTDPQLKERAGATVSRRLQTASSRSYVSSAPAGLSKDEDAGRFHSTKKGNFHEIFNLTENERPLAVCENGWRCCLINRDRKMPTDYIRNGVLYVTENYLCFESSKSGSSKRNKVIKLMDITDIQKYKVLSVLPGSGMGIAVSTPSTQKPLVFGAMVHRDEAFETIFSQYVKITSAAASGGDS